MKKAYKVLCAILALALLLFLAFSQSDKLADTLHLKKGKFNETLFASDKGAKVKKTETAAAKPEEKKLGKNEMDTTKKTILFIGDSMVECLFPRMSAYAKKNGHTFYAVIWYSSTTEVYGTRTTVKEYIDKYHPDYILFSLGGNELFVRDIKENRQKYVDEIIKQFGDIPYIWIGPPNWKPDTGINEMIESSVPEGCFYLSYTPDQHYDRKKDGAHPNAPSSMLWMDRICKWIMNESAHRIRLEKPADGEKGRPDDLVLLQPLGS
jgi:lysophospholipase L1-like esterase